MKFTLVGALSVALVRAGTAPGPPPEGCPARHKEHVPTVWELSNKVRSRWVEADELRPDVVMGALSEITSCSLCEEPTVDDLALRGSQPWFLPPAYLRSWLQDCNVELASSVRANLTAAMRELPVCSAAAGQLKSELMFGDRATIGQHLLMVIDVLWSTRGKCTPASPRNGVPGSDKEKEASLQTERTGEWQWLRGAPCASRGWSCLFLHSAEPPDDEHAITLLAGGSHVGGASRARVCAAPDAAKEAVADDALLARVTSTRDRATKLADWLAHAFHVDLASRPSAEVRAWAAAHMTEVRPELAAKCSRFPRISLQIRRGDKCAGQTNFACSPLRAYESALARVRKLYGSCSVLLATDGEEIVKELTQPNGALSDFHVTYFAFDRSEYSPKKCEPLPVCQWIEYRRGNLGTDTTDMGFSVVADLALLREGDIFVGQFDSAVGRLAWFKMASRTGVLPPYFHYQDDPARINYHPWRRGYE